jgi:hypothetical protein
VHVALVLNNCVFLFSFVLFVVVAQVCLLPMGCINPLADVAHQKFLLQEHGKLVDKGGGEAAVGREYLRIFTAHQDQVEQHNHRRRAAAAAAAAATAPTAATAAEGVSGGGGSGGSSVTVLPRDAFPLAVQSPPPALGFQDWWAWCQRCKHGGHTAHLASWFQSHDQCPVSDCNCNCLSSTTAPRSAD